MNYRVVKNSRCAFQCVAMEQPRTHVPMRQRRGHVYLRVDTKKEEPLLWKRVDAMQKQYPEHEVIADIGSGYDYRRSGLVKLMRRVIDREVSEVVVTSESQLSTLTYNHLSTVCAFYKTLIRIVKLQEDEEGCDDVQN